MNVARNAALHVAIKGSLRADAAAPLPAQGGRTS
jgi:hypothetical protein